MKETFRQSMAWFHTYCGLLFGWLLFGVFLTGSIAVFETEINLWAAPEVRSPTHIDSKAATDLGRRYLTEHAPDARQWRIALPTDREPVLRLDWRDAEGRSTTHRLDPRTGAHLRSDMDAGSFFVQYHYTLGISRSDSLIGCLIVGAAGLAMLAAIVSGVVIHKRIFRDFFTFRPFSSRQRAWMDAHNVLAVIPLPFHTMMAFTGLAFLYSVYIPAGVNTLTEGNLGAYLRDYTMAKYVDVATPPGPAAPTVELQPLVQRAEKAWGGDPVAMIYVSHPNRENAAVEVWSDRDKRIIYIPPRVAFDGATGEELRTLISRTPVRDTQAFLAGLHLVDWGGVWVRWLYFLAGLAGTAMVASALVLFVEKRDKKNSLPRGVMPMAKALTVAAVSGNIIACVAYLLAQRFYPADIADRGSLAITVYFAAWLAALIHAGLRPYRRAWTEQLAVAALLCLVLPIASLIVGVGLPVTIPRADWIRAGVDLTAGASGLFLGLSAWMVWKRSGSLKGAIH